MSSTIKGLVSKNKRRYKQDGFDLDLTYILDNVIAMGFPGEKIEGFYRNNIDDVSKFLETKHGGRYRIYNLCSERSYDPQKFKGAVVHYPFKDHNPPILGYIPQFCLDVQNWLSQNSENVVAIHCKAGKGRTGVMICCYLLHIGQAATATEALSFYAQKRTHDKKGVTIPSQQRYVGYYENLLRCSNLQYATRPVLLKEIILEGSFNTTGSTVWIFVTTENDDRFCSGTNGVEWKKNEATPFTILLECPLPLRGDVKVELFAKNMMRKEKLCHFWFNTFFLEKDPSPVKSNRGECSGPSSCNRTTVRFTLSEPSAVRNSSDNVRDLERTMSCPAPSESTQRPPIPEQWIRADPNLVNSPRSQIPEQWTRLDSLKTLHPGPNLTDPPFLFLSFSTPHLDKVNKKIFSNKSNFKITLGFGEAAETVTSPRCFRSNSDSIQSQQLRYSSSSSSSSCTDDDVSSQSSVDSTETRRLGGG